MGPIFVTAAKDGSVNVLSLMVETSGSDISVMGTYFAFCLFTFVVVAVIIHKF